MKAVYLFPIISTITWGISIVGAKILSNDGFLPIEIVFVRFGIASILFLPILITISRKNDDFLPNRNSWPAIIGLAMSGVAINNTIFYYGLNRTNASIASLIVSLTPLSTMIFATIILHEKFSKRKILSVILGIGGVALIINLNDSGQFLGNLIILLAITIWGSSFSFSRIASNNGLSSIAITGWSQILGTLFLVPFIINQNSFSKFYNLNSQAIFWFFYISILSSVFAYILHYQAIAILGAGKVAPTTNIIPFSGAIAAWILLGDTLPTTALFGATLVVIGVLIVQLERIDN